MANHTFLLHHDVKPLANGNRLREAKGDKALLGEHYLQFGTGGSTFTPVEIA